jgi:hypothetical protein
VREREREKESGGGGGGGGVGEHEPHTLHPPTPHVPNHLAGGMEAG